VSGAANDDHSAGVPSAADIRWHAVRERDAGNGTSVAARRKLYPGAASEQRL